MGGTSGRRLPRYFPEASHGITSRRFVDCASCVLGIAAARVPMRLETLGRSKRVLAALIREDIATGEPVASSLLVWAGGLGVASATVRSILARLEDEGFVQQPHASAGRVPTDHG